MGQDELNSEEEFSLKISDAVDDLFNPVRKIEIDPATNEVRDMAGGAAPAAPAPSAAPAAPAAPSAAPAAPAAADSGAAAAAGAAQEKLVSLLQQLDQSLLTLDWEVSRTNVGNMRDLLDRLVRESDLGMLAAEGGVISLMHRLLALMGDAPESVPTSGPLALKTALAAIEDAAKNGQPFGAEIRNKLEQAQSGLLAVLPGSEGKSPVSQPEPSVVNVSLPPEFVDAINAHLARLDHLLLQRLAPVQQFFGRAPRLVKIFTIIKGVTGQLTEQKKCLLDMLHGKLTQVIPVNNPVPVTIDIASQCQDIMQFHLQTLDHCARRVAPLEKLFSEMGGQYKLYAIHFEIRNGLTEQRVYLAKVLGGDFSPPPVPAKAPRPMRSRAGHCPWSTLLTGSWRGERVAFIPAQVGFAGRRGGGLAKLDSFSLKRLKSWPWSSLRSRFDGELAEKSNKELASMEFPVLNLPLASELKAGKVLVVLFQAARGGVLIMDEVLDNLSVGEHFAWKPAAKTASVFAGVLTTEFGEPIPVVDITRL